MFKFVEYVNSLCKLVASLFKCIDQFKRSSKYIHQEN